MTLVDSGGNEIIQKFASQLKQGDIQKKVWDINYSRKQEQQIPIKSDWRKCLKSASLSLLRLGISFYYSSSSYSIDAFAHLHTKLEE